MEPDETTPRETPDADFLLVSIHGGTLRETVIEGQFAVELNVPLTAPAYLFLTPAQARQWARVLAPYAWPPLSLEVPDDVS